MARIYIPYLNPVWLMEVETVEVPQYITRFMDFYFWSDRLDIQQQGVQSFYQPWQNSDVITLQLQNNAGQIQAYYINCEGQKILSFIMTQKQRNKYQPDYFIYESNTSNDPLPEGRYMLLLVIAGGNKSLISEPFYIQERCEKTMLFQYSNRSFYGNMIFETGIVPSIRVPGFIKYKKTASKDTLYEDQFLDETMIKSKPYDIYTLTVTQVPDWFIKTLVWVLGCSSVRIDGQYFTKNEEAVFEKGVSAYYDALADYTIELRPDINRNSKIIDTVEDTSDELTITLNVDSKGFADTSPENASSSVVNFLDVE